MSEPHIPVTAPPCRVCGSGKWVAVYWPDAPERTICMECCGGDVEHADGETGHQWSLRGEGCDYCGISRSDGESPCDHGDCE